MAERINASRVGNVGKPKPIYIHGKLLPVEAEYREWADKDENKNKIEGTGGVRTYAEWVRLPESKRGQKWFITVDQRMFHQDWEKPTQRGVMVDFKEWVEIVYPGITDMVGTQDKAVDTFLDRADTESWYVEAELVYTGMYNDKPQNMIRFIRMTQDVNEVKRWNAEKNPKQEVIVPDELQAQAKLIYTKMAKKDMDKFRTLITDNEDLYPFFDQLNELAPNW